MQGLVVALFWEGADEEEELSACRGEGSVVGPLPRTAHPCPPPQKKPLATETTPAACLATALQHMNGRGSLRGCALEAP
jgi:hypothetical protein